MADLKLYDVFDMAPLRDYIRGHGECRVYRKGECFCRIGVNAPEIGVVNSGGFAFIRPDDRGDDQTCSLAFADELVGAYISMMPGRKSGFDVKALCTSEVSVLALDAVVSHMDTISPDYRLRFTYAIAYAFMMRGISYRCQSVESRYAELLDRMPEVMTLMSTSAIASYLGVTRETLSRMRTRMRK
ncbi:Crp/Fnr family transcriptional regulator [Muribaculum sp.]|uniref:Crp/Fnr family transcriptional regulator n=1 Tax=Muribaculum sp. TaxID=1918611 RepID=UPI0023C70DCA|nr:Crp/Fnr family transcriptional regulator [Muribaculum sp.]MDE5706007.1 Crp/Fnr family transcriptional regulator [Muribaculum sp.]